MSNAPAGKPTMQKDHEARKAREAHKARQDDKLDQALDDSFPASDPPSISSPPPSKADAGHKH